jgi:hypothetical protein
MEYLGAIMHKVNLAGDVGFVVFGNFDELFGEVYFVHDRSEIFHPRGTD